MQIRKLMLLTLFITFASGCSMLKPKDYREQLAQIKTSAVIIYSVPEEIAYRKDPRETMKDNLLTKAIKLATKADGATAATTAHDTLVSTFGNGSLPFKVMTKEDMLANEEFAKLVAPDPDLNIGGINVTQVSGMLSMLSNDKSEPTGAAPASLKSFGLRNGQGNESEFIKQAIAALGVDAAIVIHDPGMSFNCKACVLLAGAGATGTGTTGSSYDIRIIDKSGTTLLAQQDWFDKTNASAAMAASIINPGDHKKLYEAHGQKIASNFSTYFNSYMNRK